MSKVIAFFLLLLCCSGPITNDMEIKKLTIGDRFPSIEGELLSSKQISIPEYCMGKVSILAIAFKRGTQPQIDTWTLPLLQEFSTEENFHFIEIPMISNLYSWMSNYIDNGMRSGIAESMHQNVMTYYGPLGDYYDYFDVQDKKLCYLFLLDREGKIQFISKGEATSSKLAQLIQKIKSLL